MERPAGLMISHVLSELNRSKGPVLGHAVEVLREGGYKIYTTLNKGAQAAAEAAADETVKGSYMFGQPKNLQAALVAVEPGTGRVLAYYGGHDGKGSDFAGIYFDEEARRRLRRHPAGSSFKVYTLAAALQGRHLAELLLELEPARHAGPYRHQADPQRQHVPRAQGRRPDAVLAAELDDQLAERAVLRADRQRHAQGAADGHGRRHRVHVDRRAGSR